MAFGFDRGTFIVQLLRLKGGRCERMQDLDFQLAKLKCSGYRRRCRASSGLQCVYSTFRYHRLPAFSAQRLLTALSQERQKLMEKFGKRHDVQEIARKTPTSLRAEFWCDERKQRASTSEGRNGPQFYGSNVVSAYLQNPNAGMI